MGTLIVIVVVCVGIGIIIGVVKGKKQTELYNAYQEALKGTDKMRALNAGRAYYRALYEKNYDSATVEARLNNEIATMN